jgi:hypothetical protein
MSARCRARKSSRLILPVSFSTFLSGIFALVRLSENGTEIHWLPPSFSSGVPHIPQLDVVRGEIFFARRWLIVEGQAEYLIVHSLARSLGYDLDEHGVSVIDAGRYCQMLCIGDGRILIEIID